MMRSLTTLVAALACCGCSGEAETPDPPSPPWVALSPEWRASHVAFADLDGDGLSDIVTISSAPGSGAALEPRAGEALVRIAYGRATRLAGGEAPDATIRWLLPSRANVLYAEGIQVGDFDGDGYDDLWATLDRRSPGGGGPGARFETAEPTGEPRFRIIYGGPTRLAGELAIGELARDEVAHAVVDVDPSLDVPGNFHTADVLGDIDADGCDDVQVVSNQSGKNFFNDVVWLVRGATARRRGTTELTRTDAVLPNLDHSARLILWGVGDLDADGHDDVLSDTSSTERLPRVALHYGPVEPLAIASGAAPGDASLDLGERASVWSAAGGFDLDGDGDRELVVRVRDNASLSKSFVVFGGSPGRAEGAISLSEALARIAIDGTEEQLSAGDANGDGADDLLIGLPSYRDDRGASFRYLHLPTGEASLPQADHAWFSEASREWNRLGRSVAHDGDFDGDGLADAVLASSIDPIRVIYGAAD